MITDSDRHPAYPQLKNCFLGKMGLIQREEIHIHILQFNDGPTPLSRFLSQLSPDERRQYRHFKLESRRREFLLSRLMIRRLMAAYLNREFRDIAIVYQAKGKPFMEGSFLRFNLSHTQGLIACSFSQREVGIDVEKINVLDRRDWLLLARRYFSPMEFEYLFSQPKDCQPLTFLRIFTRKEAYVKVLGRGLCCPLAGFSVPLPPEGGANSGSLEYFTPTIVGEDHYCLSHVAENPENIPLRYKIRYWDEGYLAEALMKGLSQTPWESQIASTAL